MEKHLATLDTVLADLAKETETSAKPLVVALVNAAKSRLQEHIRDAKAKAAPVPAPASPTPPTPKS